jgi:hypothetical protein
MHDSFAGGVLDVVDIACALLDVSYSASRHTGTSASRNGIRGVARLRGRRRCILSPNYPDRFWGPPSLLMSEYRQLFPLG